MAVHTILTKKQVSNFITNYNLGSLISFEGINQGIENTNYSIITELGKFILTIYEERVNVKDLPFYFELMNHSKSQNISCPVPIEDRFKKKLQSFENKKFAIFSFLDGECLKDWNEKVCFQIGKVLANFHLKNKSFKLLKSNDFGLQSWKKIFQNCKQEVDNIIPNSKGIIEEELIFLTSNWSDSLPKGIIHADFFPDNILFESGNVSGILDYYFSCFDSLIYDLAISLNAWCFYQGQFNKQNFFNLINGYQTIRSLTKIEKNKINIILRGAAMRFLMTRLNDKLYGKENVFKKNPNNFFKILEFHREQNIFAENNG